MTDDMKKPEDTTKEDPLLRVIKATPDTNKFITDQEAEGQKSFVGSDTLPINMSMKTFYALERYGVEFLEPVGDDVFQYVKLPEGWSKRPCEHPMWSDLVDNKGRVRAEIFYKAAFYDRRADIHCVPRYVVRLDYKYLNDTGLARSLVIDSGKTVYIGKDHEIPDGNNVYSCGAYALCAQDCRTWLNRNFPDWIDVTAYWNE